MVETKAPSALLLHLYLGTYNHATLADILSCMGSFSRIMKQFECFGGNRNVPKFLILPLKTDMNIKSKLNNSDANDTPTMHDSAKKVLS